MLKALPSTNPLAKSAQLNSELVYQQRTPPFWRVFLFNKLAENEPDAISNTVFRVDIQIEEKMSITPVDNGVNQILAE